ncbi:hypothetical protein ACS3SW_01050 [Roseobacteraceae bacterium S113]
MTRVMILLALVGLVAACGQRGDRVTFDGQSFRGGAKAVERGERETFEATVRQASRSVDGARQALVFEGTKYCIRWFGISRIEWDVDPLSDELSVNDNDTLTARGSCVE